MEKSAYKIHIIGAGISGLIAAKTLEKAGYSPVIIESEHEVGGRVTSEMYKEYILDHGFQVLLTSYPEANKHLDFNTLQLQRFLPGAAIFKNGKQQIIGDPTREISLLLPTMLANVGNFADKLKILKLNALLKKKSIDAIFEEDEKSTYQYLEDFGFSKAIINDFFTPFFSGIFLEPNLETSSRMFEFVYKMLGSGDAAIPLGGIQAISNQLKSQLSKTKFLFQTAVKEVKNNDIILQDGSVIKTHMTIIATDASHFITNLKNQETNWKSCDTLYFEVLHRTIQKPLIGLVADSNALINNIFFHNSVQTASQGIKELLSVTVVKKHDLSEKELVAKVTEDLATYCQINDVTFLKRFKIKKALPKISNLQYSISSTETKLTSTIFLAGDQLLNGSLNAAMISGEQAAKGVVETIEGGLVVDELTSEFK